VESKMNKTFLTATGVIIFLAMIGVTSWASLHESVFSGGAKIISEPWGIATLFDTYFGFFFFTLWVWYKERSLAMKVGWFIFIMCFGNIAMAIFFLKEIRRVSGSEFSVEKLLVERK